MSAKRKRKNPWVMQRTSTPSISKFIISSASALNMWHCFFSYFISEPVHCFYLWRMNGVWIIKNTLAVTHSSSTNTRVFILPVKIKLFFFILVPCVINFAPRPAVHAHLYTVTSLKSAQITHTRTRREEEEEEKKNHIPNSLRSHNAVPISKVKMA